MDLSYMKIRVVHGLLPVILLVVSPLQLAADDFGLWLGAGAEKKLGSGWSIGIDGEWRTADRVSVGLSATYKIAKWLKATGGYELQDVRSDGGLTGTGNYYNSTCWHLRHRLFAGLTGTWKTGRWKFSLRERWTYTYAPSYERHRMTMNSELATYGEVTTKEVDAKAKNVLRSRVGVEYDIPKCPLAPYGSVELYNAWNVEKVRYTLGAEYKLNKQNTLKIYYLFQDRKSHDDDEPAADLHVLGVSYGVTF